MTAGFIALTLIAFAVWQFSQPPETDASTSTPLPATATQTLSIPTTAPTETAAPTETIVPPTTVVIPGIGGSDRIALTANKDVYVMDINGKNIRQLTNTNLTKFDLQWLPGGNELLYGEGKCVYKIDANTLSENPEKLVCFTDEKFEGFRVSPDGKYVAISIQRRLIIFPFDQTLLAAVPSAFELQGSESACLDYTKVAVKSARWSADGKSIAILYQGAVGNQLRVGDVIRVLEVDTASCQDVDPLIAVEFPARGFVPEDYEDDPTLPAYDWNSAEQILFNTYKRNERYGHLYLYDISASVARKIDPINGDCCYGDSVISPDGTHILIFFQDESLGANSETQMYYIPIDQLGSETAFTPIKLGVQFFLPRENIEAALRPSAP
jgi:dipeptidyl aminopeptidase/acylaminoacyl peptidase